MVGSNSKSGPHSCNTVESYLFFHSLTHPNNKFQQSISGILSPSHHPAYRWKGKEAKKEWICHYFRHIMTLTLPLMTYWSTVGSGRLVGNTYGIGDPVLVSFTTADGLHKHSSLGIEKYRGVLVLLFTHVQNFGWEGIPKLPSILTSRTVK